ncbi:hypothetical protein PLESTB_001080400 [Pleodorina starrii]|uniref:EF-hand domain-containing protein n=1 Tax=Pleodorina starrii TaxID=330485 RepID=A0A9W6BQC8_9CHLO|nr:hypothetical protein PLESTM_001178500 [Pleodorina starrii]GLC56213.1 hypothetical protein PLESTB_001080400 [Pleodorina starrii]GLC69153.1 hypothetical protein PLESTF_000795700 [Pleodorina starrii]
MDVLTSSALRKSPLLSRGRAARRHPLVPLASSIGHQRSEPPKATVTLTSLNPRSSETELVLDQAQQDLTELCKTEEGLECWKALGYFVTKRQQLEQHCNLELDEGEHDPQACTSLNGLEKFVREQMSAGCVQNLRSNLLIMQRIEERRATGGGASAAAAPPLPAMTEKELHAKACLIRLFHALDTNGDGEIGMLEFQDGMEALGAVLTEDDMRQISDALDNGRNQMDIDEFVEVMQASPVLHGVAMGDDSNFLRHAAHVHGHHAGPASAKA